ncbi:MAG: efflux RND transporter periplasmic adaptor subunit [Planctomycetota bacterium]
MTPQILPSAPRTLAALALALGSFVTQASAQGPGGPAPVRVDGASVENVQEMRRVTGEIRAKQSSLVAVREGGIVSELLVREGDRVEEGQPLARLDGVRLGDELAVLLAQLEESRAAVEEQRAVVSQAEFDLTTLEELAKRDAANQKELVDARSSLAVERARLARSERGVTVFEARRQQLQQRVADMEPRAPFSGVVVARHTEVGAWLAAGAPIVQLVSDRSLEVRLDVPQAYWSPLAASQDPIQLGVDAVGSRTSTNWRMVPAIQTAGRTFPLIAELDDAEGLAPGMSVTATVPTGERADRLTVSRDGVLQGPTGFYVYVARPGADGAPHTAAIAPVQVLFYSGDRVVVQSPALTAGDLVVVEGNERLYPGQPVAPMGGSGQ